MPSQTPNGSINFDSLSCAIKSIPRGLRYTSFFSGLFDLSCENFAYTPGILSEHSRMFLSLSEESHSPSVLLMTRPCARVSVLLNFSVQFFNAIDRRE